MVHDGDVDDDQIAAAIDDGTGVAMVIAWARRRLGDIAVGAIELRGVQHPLGFVCLPVTRKHAFGLCIHVWDPELSGGAPTTSPYHSHCWDLKSLVLYGRVANVRVAVADSQSAGHQVFEVRSRGDTDELRATGRRVDFVTTKVEVSGAGEIYRLPSGRFHCTEIAGSPEAATVVLGRMRPGMSDLTLGGLETPTHTIRRRSWSTRSTARAARIAAGRLSVPR